MNKQSGLRAVVTLLLITVVMAGLLAAVNSITEKPIAQYQAEKTQQALAGVLADGVTLGQALDAFHDETGLITGVYATSDGYVMLVTTAGYGGDIDMAVGVSSTGSVTGVELISHSETSNLGANAERPEFREQFVGLTEPAAVTKDGGTIEALTGATVTSRAITRGVNAALACAAALEGGSGA